MVSGHFKNELWGLAVRPETHQDGYVTVKTIFLYFVIIIILFPFLSLVLSTKLLSDLSLAFILSFFLSLSFSTTFSLSLSLSIYLSIYLSLSLTPVSSLSLSRMYFCLNISTSSASLSFLPIRLLPSLHHTLPLLPSFASSLPTLLFLFSFL